MYVGGWCKRVLFDQKIYSYVFITAAMNLIASLLICSDIV